MRPELHAILRTDFRSFMIKVFETLHPGQPPLSDAWYLRAMCHHLAEASEGDIRRLVITVPPRHLKSISAAVALPAFLLGRYPSMKIMVASYSQDLARQHAEQCRTIMKQDWYGKVFGGTRISERGNRQLELITTANGQRKAISVGGSVTGFGADLIIVDDCMKADEALSQAARDELVRWFDGTLMTRLNDKGKGRIISIQQRLHEADLSAYLLDKGYAHLNLPAVAERAETIATGHRTSFRREIGALLDPAREDRAVLDQLRRELGPVVFSAQYQQNPTVPEGNLIRLDWFGTYDSMPEREAFKFVIQSWDTAATAEPTSDWTAGMTWGLHDKQWYLLDVMRRRMDYPDLKRAVLLQKASWSPNQILIENASTGIALVRELRSQGHHEVLSPPCRGDKIDRLIASTGELETGKFLLPRDAPWLTLLQSELRAFPNGRHDDQVDALSQFVNFQKLRRDTIEAEYAPNGRRLSIKRQPGMLLR